MPTHVSNCIRVIRDFCQKFRSPGPISGQLNQTFWCGLYIFPKFTKQLYSRAAQCLPMLILSFQQKGGAKSFCRQMEPWNFGKWAVSGSNMYHFCARTFNCHCKTPSHSLQQKKPPGKMVKAHDPSSLAY